MFFLCVTGEHLIEVGGGEVTALAWDDGETTRGRRCATKAIQQRLDKERGRFYRLGMTCARMLSRSGRITALQAGTPSSREAEFDVAPLIK